MTITLAKPCHSAHDRGVVNAKACKYLKAPEYHSEELKIERAAIREKIDYFIEILSEPSFEKASKEMQDAYKGWYNNDGLSYEDWVIKWYEIRYLWVESMLQRMRHDLK
jgi:hypothetical protein